MHPVRSLPGSGSDPHTQAAYLLSLHHLEHLSELRPLPRPDHHSLREQRGS